jgi:hypothetical protein
MRVLLSDASRAARWLVARLHTEVIHERGLGALLRGVDAPDSAQFLRYF